VNVLKNFAGKVSREYISGPEFCKRFSMLNAFGKANIDRTLHRKCMKVT
jgi:hypothetical protein